MLFNFTDIIRDIISDIKDGEKSLADGIKGILIAWGKLLLATFLLMFFCLFCLAIVLIFALAIAFTIKTNNPAWLGLIAADAFLVPWVFILYEFVLDFCFDC